MRRTVATLLGALLAASASACSAPEPASQSEDIKGIPRALAAAARENLVRVAREIDEHHVRGYDLEGELADQFLEAVAIEYRDHPELLRRRVETLASMVFFSAPEVETPSKYGRKTPFHGMDEHAFEALMHNEDFVFGHHMQVNGGSPNGVRPFSVCETRFLIAISKGEVSDPEFVSNARLHTYDPYARAYAAFAKECPKADLEEWYNFRGLGGLRPSWLESNVSDRFLRRMVSACDDPDEDEKEACAEWDAGRLAYRDRKNAELALRTMFYDPRPEAKVEGLSGELTMEEYLLDPKNAGVLVEDRNGDGIGEWIAAGPLRAAPGAKLGIPTNTTFRLSAETEVALAAEATVITSSGEKKTLPSGAKLFAEVGSEAAFTAKHTVEVGAPALEVSAKTRIRLAAGARLRLEDGSSARVPSSYEIDGSDAPPGLLVKPASELVFPFQEGFEPVLTIDPPLAGAFAGQKFAGELHVALPLADGQQVMAYVATGDVVAHDAVDPAWKPEFASRPDLGLLEVFADGQGCTGDSPKPEECDLLRRFYSIIDRHEDFYQTYSGLQPASAIVSQQPSPLVACSVTLAAAHEWSSAGTPKDGTAGFIYLMRIPFSQILSGDTRSIDTLGLLEDGSLHVGPRTLTVQEIYEEGAELDLRQVWLDIATLSNNQYAHEHEISKFGSVPAEQIEGILVVRRPAAMP